jgi:tetratricopeptide (TPR) repeat protein
MSYARYYQALSEARRGRQSIATDILRELVSEEPDIFDFVYALADSLEKQSRYAEAEPVFLRANELQPNDPPTLAGLGMSYAMRGKFDKAIPYFDEAFRLKPEVEFYKMFVNMARGRQRLVSEIPAITAAVERDPDNLKLRLNLARVLVFANRLDEAEKHIEYIYSKDPADYNIYHVIGVTYDDLGHKEQALRAYKMAIEKGEYAGSYFGAAAIYRDRGNFEAASAAFEKGIEKKPDTPNFMKWYGDLLLNNGKRREALDMYKRSLALLPTNAIALFDAAVLSAKLGEKSAALAYLGTLRSIDPVMARKLENCLKLLV